MSRSRTAALALVLSVFLLALPSLAAARTAYFTGNEGGSKPFAAPVDLVTHAVGGENTFGISAEGSPADVAITPDGDGCELLIRHVQLTRSGAAERHRAGWHGALDQLAALLRGPEAE